MAKGQQRDPKLEAFWRGVLGRFGKGGLGVREFCRREKVSEPAFYAWRRIVRERDAERPRGVRRRQPRQETVPAFVPVVVRHEQAGSTEAGIIIELRGGRVLRLPTAITGARLGELIVAVEAVPVGDRP